MRRRKTVAKLSDLSKLLAERREPLSSVRKLAVA
jgi:hypothetical protein